ncbi:cytochrome c-type biogenesis protein [Asaia krungthepensis]|uniref:Cytochrome c-type biogenesis protein n=1 Tax=Asaia krungthepensis NRIC 0535 TaxID=1307925 RepID=A0ABQ0Q678_9PROT|nr:cytochrome c-type biogenesis protein [Asaia krungthepensis]GBQ93268.1 cytochrome c-type biogenesis protein CycL [Asaia krungthepensis NRIC 0535]
MNRAQWMAMMTIALLGIALPARALDDPSEKLSDPVQEKRAETIGAQLRCLVCQNESIEDSSADLARDLRHVVRTHVAAGESDQQIMTWMTRRYGEFIRLRPGLSAATLLLWIMPVLALTAGLLAAFLMLRRRAAATPQPEALTAAEQARLARIMQEEGPAS